MAIPRIGHEVVVDFLGGDTDQPLITGRTYHATNRPPYPLPENKTKMVIRSDTHKGQGFNELSCEDEHEKENIFLHAEKDHEVQCKNNRSKRVDVSEVISVCNKKYSEVGKDFNFQIGGNAVTAVGVSDVQINATKPMDSHDQGPLELAYRITDTTKPDATRGHYKLMVVDCHGELTR